MRASEAVVEACRLLEGEAPMETRAVARAVGLSDAYFQRCFKRTLGVTPQQYRRRVLAERGREAIRDTSSVTESVYAAGYSSSSRFYEGVGRELGMRPSVAATGGVGETIAYATAECSLGRLLVAWTARGVCEVAFGDSDPVLVDALAARFESATVAESPETTWIGAVIDSVEMQQLSDVPLDIRGTAFQERVWQMLRSIPAGETRTYGEIAAALGRPSASRAVAKACATNRLAVLVPCHRVVRKDGDLAGYRWGVQRKRELLRRESEARSEELENP